MKKKSIIRLSIISVVGIALIFCAFAALKNLPNIVNYMSYLSGRNDTLAVIKSDTELNSINKLNDDDLLKSANDAFVNESEDDFAYMTVLEYRIPKMKTKKLINFISDENNNEELKGTITDWMLLSDRFQLENKSKKLIALLDEPVCDTVKESIVRSADFRGNEDKLKQLIFEKSDFSDEALKNLDRINPNEAYAVTADIFADAANYNDDMLRQLIIIEQSKLEGKQTVFTAEKQQAAKACAVIINTRIENGDLIEAANKLLSKLIAELYNKDPNDAYAITADIFADVANYSDDILWRMIPIENNKLSASNQSVSDAEKQQVAKACAAVIKSHGEKNSLSIAADELLSKLVSETEKQALLEE